MVDKQKEADASENSERDFSDLRRAVIATATSSVTRVIARILLIIFVVDLYGISNFGYLGEVAASVELLAAMACFGLPKTIMAYFNRHKDDAKQSADLVSNALCLVALVAAILSLIIVLAWPYLFPKVPAYMGAAIFIIATTEIFLTLTRSRRIIKWESIVKGVVKPWGFFILAMVGYFIAIKQYDAQPIIILMAAYFSSLLISWLIAFIGFYNILKNQHISLGKVKINALFTLGKESAPIAIVDAGSFAFWRLDIIILGIFTSSSVTGIYYLGQQLASVVEKMRHLFEPMAAPILAQTQSTQTIGIYLQKTCRWIFAASMGIAICTTIYAELLMELFNVYYLSAILFMGLLLIGVVADGSTGLVELPIIFRNPFVASRNVILALIVEAIAVAIGAYYFGILGAAAGFSIAMIILALLRIYSAKKLYDMDIINREFFKPIFAAILALIPSLMIKDIMIYFGPFGMILGVIIFAGLYVFLLKLMGISMKISDNS